MWSLCYSTKGPFEGLLITTFEDRMLEIDSLKKSIFSEHSNVIEQLSKLIGSFQVDFQNQAKALSGIVDDSLIAAAVSTNEKLDSYSQRWSAEKETVLSSIGGLQDKLSTEIQSQNVKLSELASDLVRLQELKNEQSRQHLVKNDELHRLLNEVNARATATAVDLDKRLKVVVWSFSSALVVTIALFGYLQFAAFV
jgi:hypothetical protein